MADLATDGCLDVSNESLRSGISVSQPAANKLLLREFGVLERNSVRLPLLPMDQVPESLEVVRRLAS